MAIHTIVLVTADRRWRISADPAGTRFTVEHDNVWVAKVNTLPELVNYLAEHGIELADLEQL